MKSKNDFVSQSVKKYVASRKKADYDTFGCNRNNR